MNVQFCSLDITALRIPASSVSLNGSVVLQFQQSTVIYSKCLFNSIHVSFFLISLVRYFVCLQFDNVPQTFPLAIFYSNCSCFCPQAILNLNCKNRLDYIFCRSRHFGSCCVIRYRSIEHLVPLKRLFDQYHRTLLKDIVK